MSNKSLVRIQKQLASGDLSSNEYYTRYEDIANELSLYKEQLEGKRIICPCDWDVSGERERERTYQIIDNDLWETTTSLIKKHTNNSKIQWVKTNERTKQKILENGEKPPCNFWKYLINKMLSGWKIKSVTFSGYDPKTKNGIPFQEQDYSKYDVVITNPPFSLSKEFVDLLIKEKIKFLIISSKMFANSAEASKHIVNQKLWLGYHMPDKYMMPYLTKNEYEKLDENSKKSIKWDSECYWNNKKGCYIKAIPAYWYTNLDVSYRHDLLVLNKKYKGHEKEFLKLSNFEGLFLEKTSDIPSDYDGLMAVPMSFLRQFNPNQFEIIGGYDYWKKNWKQMKKKFPSNKYPKMLGGPTPVVNGERRAGRFIIKN
ncbi:MAG: adenine-specific methyltransferase EcoRI family protein, partial [Mycoplasmataceae bacterium]|nr:adenine-specific methyltransferase EcoRI family protein [Mycoplasmataceae bacterium]